MRIDPDRCVDSPARSPSTFTLNVGDSYIKDQTLVATFFTSIIGKHRNPALRLLLANGCPHDIKRKWLNMERMVPALLAGRAHRAGESLFGYEADENADF
jgi:hypothetical protein